MAKKLYNLRIEHIAGVDRAANKRTFLVIKSEKKPEPDPIEKSVWIESTERYRVTDEDGKFCVYGGDDGRKMGEFDNRKEAVASIMKITKADGPYIEKEGEKYCLYNAEGKKIGTFDSMADARAKMKMMGKGATMLKKEQIVKIADKEIQEAVLTQQEEMAALEKENKELKEKVAKGGGDPEVDLTKEEAWRGVPPGIRNRFEALEKERDDADKLAKAEKDKREVGVWVTKAKTFKYLQITPDPFGKILKAVAEQDLTNAEEIFRVLTAADALIEKGTLFSELGKNHNNGKERVHGDATGVVARVESLAEDFMAADKTGKMTKQDAILKVFHDHGDWYKPYTQEVQVKV